MRSLSWRILIPFVVTFTGCFVVFAVLTVQTATDAVEQARRREMALAASVLRRPGFPLAPAVLGAIADAWQLDLAVAETNGKLRAVTLERADEREALGAWWRTTVLNATNAGPETPGAHTPDAPGASRRAHLRTLTLGSRAFRVWWEWRYPPGGEREGLVLLANAADIARQKEAAAEPAVVMAGVGILLVAIIGAGVARSLARPLGELARTAARVAQGDFAQRAPEAGALETRLLARAFNAMVLSLKRSQQALVEREKWATLGQLSAHLAHEIRNPLGGIRLNLDLLAPQTPLEHEVLDVVRRELDRLEGFLAQLMSAFREAPEVPFAPIDLAAVSGEVAALLGPQLTHQRVALEFDTGRDTAPPLPPIRADASAVKQVLMNLVLNAAQALGAAGGTIAIRVAPSPQAPQAAPAGPATREADAQAVSAAATASAESTAAAEPREDATPAQAHDTPQPPPSSVRLSVSDDGPGIPEALRDSLFEPFASGREGGTGLGLAIVKGILDRHGARMQVTTSEAGTTFEIDWPTHESASAPPPAAPA